MVSRFPRPFFAFGLSVLLVPALVSADGVVGAAATGGDSVKRISGSNDIVHTFTQSGTFTLEQDTEVRYLVVGGGGAGGLTASNNSGGGGGAGGFLTGTTNLPAGTYTVTVGAGGASIGQNGSSSLIENGAGTVLFEAFGGGGGGSGGNAGSDGASGGGGGSIASGSTAGGAGTPGQGYGGGLGGTGTNWVDGSYTETTGGRVYGLDTVAGGGGGAGGPGGESNVDKHTTVTDPQYGGYQRNYHAGDGGPGLPSDITGEEVWYAGGGGGSAYHHNRYVAWGGAGGKGGGGMGDWSLLPQSEIDGRPNSGGGGGGQSRTGSPCYGAPIYWGRGGSGVVILRYAAQADAVGIETPILVGAHEESVDVRTWAIGSGTAEKVVWGEDAAALTNEAAVTDGVATLAPLQSGKTYYARAVGGSLSGELASFFAEPYLSVSFSTDDAEMTQAPGSLRVVTFKQDGSFRLTNPATVRILAVGGGGGGGVFGGGGGAGGMLETNLTLLPGTYTVTVGAGGAAAASVGEAGGKGGDTVLALDGTPILTAWGGGGGASWNCYGVDALPVTTGGSGGGATYRDKPGTYLDAAQGSPGGPTIFYLDKNEQKKFECQDGNPGGGGGAGGRGLSMIRWPKDDAYRRNGDGGPGRVSDITGTSLVYAAGGGAGSGAGSTNACVKAAAGYGGRGADSGSGHGVRLDATERSGDEDGLPNTGDGGGGGTDLVAGGAGGSGVFILTCKDRVKSSVFVLF